MKHLSNLFRKLTLVAAVATGLASCNRAEYALLPKTSSAYHGTPRATIGKPAPTVAVAASAVLTPAVAPGVATPAPVANVASAPAKAATASKPTLMQRALVQKIAKKADKLAAKVRVDKKAEVAKTSRLEGRLRQGVILLLIGLLIGVLGSITGLGIISLLGSIVAVIGLVLIVLYLLDEV